MPLKTKQRMIGALETPSSSPPETRALPREDLEDLKQEIIAQCTERVLYQLAQTLESFASEKELSLLMANGTLPEDEEPDLLSEELSPFKHKIWQLITSLETYPETVVRPYEDPFPEKLFSTAATYRNLKRLAANQPAGQKDSALIFWKTLLRELAMEKDLQPVRRDKKPPTRQFREHLPEISFPSPGNGRSNRERPEAVPSTDHEVNNAGIILLHPFLKLFFERVGLYGNGRFIDATAHARAVLLTQYMVMPVQEMATEDLLLNKILCGYPVSEPLPPVMDISGTEILEINKLLMTIIGSWKRQGVQVNTTKSNLRGAFLQRLGRLTRQHHDWHLLIKQKGYDIVLNNFPWTIGIIRCNEMNNLLKVTWIK